MGGILDLPTEAAKKCSYSQPRFHAPWGVDRQKVPGRARLGVEHRWRIGLRAHVGVAGHGHMPSLGLSFTYSRGKNRGGGGVDSPSKGGQC